MGGRRSNNQINTKKVAGNERKASQRASRENQLAQQQEEQLAKEWKIGSDVRGAQRREQAALKSDKKTRKTQEKLKILREEEILLGKNSSKAFKNTKKTKIKGIKNNNNYLALLEDSLVTDAKKKINLQTKKQEKKSKLEKKRLKLERDRINIIKEKDEMTILMENTQNMIDDKSMNIPRTIDSALNDMEISNSATPLYANNKKAFYKAYEEKMLVQLKEKYPGLRLNQYKDRISTMWRRHYEKLERPSS